MARAEPIAPIPVGAFPTNGTLAERLARVLNVRSGLLAIAQRVPVRLGANLKEVVTYRVGDRQVTRVFCKYAGEGLHTALPHRGGVQYEAAVYRILLSSRAAGIPRYIGEWNGSAGERFCLVLEAVDGPIVTKQDGRLRIADAATWLGRFHSTWDHQTTDDRIAVLTRYSSSYYAFWADRTRRFSRCWFSEHPWLPGLCDLVEKDTDSLFVGPATVIHGEFYPQNVLASASGLHAIDWESAAFAPGEIDLAMLLDGWAPTDARRIEDAYAEARWPGGAPDYGRRLDAARLYVQMRWLGDRPEWTAHPDIRRRLARLRAAAESLNLL